MDLDDSAEKVRRNVVVFSCAIIAITLLDISVVRGTLFGLEIKTASPSRVWALFTLAAIYLLQRFHFDEATKKMRVAAANDFAQGAIKKISRDLWNDLHDMVVNRKAFDGVWIQSIKGTYLSELAETRDITDLKAEVTIVEHHGENLWPIWRRVARLKKNEVRVANMAGFKQEERMQFVTGPIMLPYDVGHRFYLAAVKQLIQSLHSKGLVDVLVPYALGIIALIVCISHVAAAICKHL